MADDKPNEKPEGPFGQDYWDKACFPGRFLTFVITDCTTGAPIILFTARDNTTIVPSNNGRNILTMCTLPGYQFTVSANGYIPVQVTVNRQMFDDRNAVICLPPVPPPPNLPPPTTGEWCFLSAALTGKADAADEFLDLARAFRDIAITGQRGADLVSLYYGEESEPLFRGLLEDKEMAFALMAITLRLAPFVARVIEAARAPSDAPRPALEDEKLDRAIAKAILIQIELAEARFGSYRVLKLLRETVENAVERGMLRALLTDDR